MHAIIRDVVGATLFLAALCWGLASRKIRPTVPERLGRGDWSGLADKAVGKKWIWIHAASVGELTGLQPLLPRLIALYPNRAILVTTTSATGKTRALTLPGVTAACVLPVDVSFFYAKALDSLVIERMCIFETELWPSLLAYLQQRSIPTVLINARMTAKAFKNYRRFRQFLAPLLTVFEKVFVQTETDWSRFLAIGISESKLLVTGSTKFDIASDSREVLANKVREQYQINAQEPCLAIGCLRADEEEQILPLVKKLSVRLPSLQIIIAPRHPERFAPVLNFLSQQKIPTHRRSQGMNTDKKRVILLDMLGELNAVYALADLALVCGSFATAGGHNPVEAALVHTPVIIGPDVRNFVNAVHQLKSHGGLTQVVGSEELEDLLSVMLADRAALHRMGLAAAQGAASLRGASDLVMRYLGEEEGVRHVARAV